MEIPKDEEWIAKLLNDTLRPLGFEGASWNRVFDAIAKDAKKLSPAQARQRAGALVTGIVAVVGSGFYPTEADMREKLRKRADRDRSINAVLGFLEQIEGQDNLPRTLKKRASGVKGIVESLRGFE